ncbi:hypothetical protein MKY98_26990 [Paenibacillus sp. FSL M8-0228]|uniref:hypothetical protein n=1 Tax=Paenibacillus sp. FSL M8-0228 TaxID=2921620 RepID=UPI0030F88F5D
MALADIFQFAGAQLAYLSPALLVFVSLAFTDRMAAGLIRIIKFASKRFKI